MSLTQFQPEIITNANRGNNKDITLDDFIEEYGLEAEFKTFQKEIHTKYPEKEAIIMDSITNIINNRISDEYYENSMLLLCIGVYYEYKDIDYELAKKYYQLSYTVENSNIFAMHRLGCLYESLEQDDLAIKCYNIAKVKGYPESIVSLGDLYKEQGKMDLAEIEYKIAVGYDNSSAMNNLGLLYDKKGKHNLAIHYYKLAVDKMNTAAMNNLGLLYQEQDKNELAIEHYLLSIQNNNYNAITHIQKLMPKVQLYHTLSKLPTQNVLITNILANLRKDEKVHCFNNKINFLSKDGTCLVCFDDKKLIPRECAHFYCTDCFVKIDKCSMCKF
jgi:tetratricopeptide (TPR) repeat protein